MSLSWHPPDRAFRARPFEGKGGHDKTSADRVIIGPALSLIHAMNRNVSREASGGISSVSRAALAAPGANGGTHGLRRVPQHEHGANHVPRHELGTNHDAKRKAQPSHTGRMKEACIADNREHGPGCVAQRSRANRANVQHAAGGKYAFALGKDATALGDDATALGKGVSGVQSTQAQRGQSVGAAMLDEDVNQASAACVKDHCMNTSTAAHITSVFRQVQKQAIRGATDVVRVPERGARASGARRMAAPKIPAVNPPKELAAGPSSSALSTHSSPSSSSTSASTSASSSSSSTTTTSSSTSSTPASSLPMSAPLSATQPPLPPSLSSASSVPVSVLVRVSWPAQVAEPLPLTGPRPLPQLYFNCGPLTRLFSTFVARGPSCPMHALITGPSGTGKTWAMRQVAAFWAQCTSPANVMSSETFEAVVERGLPVPTDPLMLMALDDIDCLSEQALVRLRVVLASKRPGAHVLATVADVYAQPRLAFLKAVRSKTALYRPRTDFHGNAQVMARFVQSLRLHPAPPKPFVDRAVAVCNGNLHRLVNMVTNQCPDTMSAALDDMNPWEEERLFRKGFLPVPPTEACALMVAFNTYDNARPRSAGALAAAATVLDRYSHSLALLDPWAFWVCDLDLPGNEHAFANHMAARSRQAHLRRLVPTLCRFFEAWGCDVSSLSRAEDRMLAFHQHWIERRAQLRSDHADTMRILILVGEDTRFLRTLDKIMGARQTGLSTARSPDLFDADTALLEFVRSS